MATYTENLGLEKPDLDDFYDVTKRNDNYDKIDEAIGNLDDDMTDHKTDPDTHANLKYYVKKAGDTMIGALTVSTGDDKNITLNDGNIKMTGASIAKNTNDSVLSFNGSVDTLNGSTLFVYGKDSAQAGKFRLRSNNGSTYKDLVGEANGTLTWNNKNIVRSINGVDADAEGNVQVGNNGTITGKIEWFAFNTVPDGYLVCNGANVSRAVYADLFAVIGTIYGAGDGSTTFTLPNLVDRFIKGTASAVGKYLEAGLPNITGTVYTGDGGHSVSIVFTRASGAIAVNTASYGTTPYYDTGITSTIGFNIDATRSSAIYGKSITVQPPSLTLLPCIKY